MNLDEDTDGGIMDGMGFMDDDRDQAVVADDEKAPQTDTSSPGGAS